MKSAICMSKVDFCFTLKIKKLQFYHTPDSKPPHNTKASRRAFLCFAVFHFSVKISLAVNVFLSDKNKLIYQTVLK